MNKKIRFGIVGAGDIARKFANDIKVVENSELVAVASRTLDKAQKFAKECDVDFAFGSYEELAESDAVDAVYIATPHNFHKEQSVLFLRNKKHVLCEKPITVNANELLEMIEVAKEHNCLLMQAMWTWFLPATKYVKEVIDSKKYGEIKHMDLSFGFNLGNLEKVKHKRHLNINLAGGSLLDVGIYPLSMAYFLKDLPVKRFKAESTFYETGVDLSTDIEFQYSDHSVAQLHSALNSDLDNHAIIELEHGKIIMKDFWKAQSIVVNEELKEFPFKASGFEYEIESFSNTLLNNKLENDVMTHKKSIEIMELLDVVRKKIGLKYPNE